MISSSAPKCHRLFVCECEDSFAKDRFRGPYDGPYSEPHVPWPWNSAGYAIYERYKHIFHSYYITAIIFVVIALIAMNMPSSFKFLCVRPWPNDSIFHSSFYSTKNRGKNRAVWPPC